MSETSETTQKRVNSKPAAEAIITRSQLSAIITLFLLSKVISFRMLRSGRLAWVVLGMVLLSVSLVSKSTWRTIKENPN